ncbi:MAG TPA: hypothetical protein VHX59_11000 [Mycobacteriales bacterium]|nr:hypothetical protein [Mycobacteriales bacterium]
MTQRYEHTETRRKRRGALISCAALFLLAGCSSTVDGKATFSADGSGRGGGPGLTVPTATSPNGSPSDAPSSDAPSSTASSSDAPSSAAPSRTARPTPKPKPKPKLKAKIHGWQPVGHQVRRIAYDAPPNWKVASADTIIGFEDSHGPQTAMSAASQYRSDFCKPHDGSSRAGAGVAAARGSNLSAAAHAAARDWGRAAYEDGVKHATMKIGRSKPLRIAGVHAVEVVANVTAPHPAKCGAPRGMVIAVAISGVRSAGIFIVYADLDVKSAAPTKVLNEMVGSVRPIP